MERVCRYLRMKSAHLQTLLLFRHEALLYNRIEREKTGNEVLCSPRAHMNDDIERTCSDTMYSCFCSESNLTETTSSAALLEWLDVFFHNLDLSEVKWLRHSSPGF